MSDHFQLRLTAAGRAALADSANIGTRAVRYTKIAIGSGHGPGGEADDGRAALRAQRDEAAVEGSTVVAGEIAVCAFLKPAGSYDVREVGLFGRVEGVETLHAFWTDPEAVFAAAASGGQVVVAGRIAIGPLAADAALGPVSAKLTLQSQGLLPSWLLPLPHAAADSRTLAVEPEAAASGGIARVPAGQRFSLAAHAARGAASGFVQPFATGDWATPELPANAVRYLRAQAILPTNTTEIGLRLYTAGGADDDPAPGSLLGTPGASRGGGFGSTPFDARIAKIRTGAAGSVPEVTLYRLDASARGGAGPWSALDDYAHPVDCWGSDDVRYTSVRDSGPRFGGPVDPTADADRSHWLPARLVSGQVAATPAGTDKAVFSDESAAGKPNRIADINKLPVVGGSAQGSPAKTDRLKFGDVSAAGVPNLEVEIQKLPGALAPAGGVTLGGRYALKALAGGAFELARVLLLTIFVTEQVSAGGPAGNQGGSVQLGQTLSVPAGTYTVLFGYNRSRSSGHATAASARLQYRTGGGRWINVGGFTNAGRTGFYFSNGYTGYSYRTGWEISQAVEVRIWATSVAGWSRFEKAYAALLLEDS